MKYRQSVMATVLIFVAMSTAVAARLDEIKVKRKDVFEFTQKPKVSRNGDKITIDFAVKDYCDVAIAVEDEQAQMVRHVAAGVLGNNAPAPFQKDSLRQSIVWDGKDDQGHYVDDKDSLTIRVSLGIKPQYERSLFWSPYKRKGSVPPLIAPTPEGVYILDSLGANTIRLYDHDGNYVRTAHPPPASKILALKGAEYKTSPQTGKQVPVLRGFTQGTFLSGADDCYNLDVTHHGDTIFAGTSFTVNPAVQKKGPRRIASAYLFLNRLSTDGSTDGLTIEGPEVGIRNVPNAHWHHDYGRVTVGPSSLAFSPDGKKLYMTGYLWNVYGAMNGNTEAILHGVQVMDFESNEKPSLFAGKMTFKDDGSDNEHFAGPTSVACDAEGRVYVSDFLNSRIQVFSPEGKFLKTLPVKYPSKVMVSHRDGEIMVFSWPIACFAHRLAEKYKVKLADMRNDGLMTWTSLGRFEKPGKADPKPLPVKSSGLGALFMGQPIEVSWDPWAKEPTIWVAARKGQLREFVVKHHGRLAWEDSQASQWVQSGIAVYVLRNDKWVIKKDFDKDVRKAIYRHRPATFHGQRLSVNPTNRKLYLLEYRGHLGMKSNIELLEIDPETGKVRPRNMPMAAETVTFDMDGHAYLRDSRMVMRYTFGTWREIPWDYGESRQRVGMAEATKAIAGLALPGQMPCTGHQEGMSISTRMRLIVSCYNAPQQIKFTFGKTYTPGEAYKPYEPRVYPGRIRWQELHVFDRSGKVLYEDAVPGLAHLSGVAMDEEDNIYVLAAGARVADDGKSPFNPWSGTLMKFKPGKGRIVGSKERRTETAEPNFPQVSLSPDDHPKRTHDLYSDSYEKAWVDGAEWMVGGIGWNGWSHGGTHRGNRGLHWDDWASRFGFDRYSRSFVHEMDNYSIAVVDKNGNVIMRFGQYGNEQDGKPLIADGGAVNPVSIGGSEVALARPMTMAADSDRRLFVTDAMNAKILSIKLGYHAEAKVALKDVPDQKK